VLLRTGLVDPGRGEAGMMMENMNEMNTVIGRSGLLALVMMCYILRKQGKYGVLYLICMWYF
jgi:hypothetical protein